MKKLFIALGLVAAMAAPAVAQEIVIMPSDIWMKANGFGHDENIQGKTATVCDYAKAYSSSSKLVDITTRFTELFGNEGFEVVQLDERLKEINMGDALDAMGNREQSPTELLLNTIQPDIKVELSWEEQTSGMYTKVDINVRAMDPYTNTAIGTMSHSGENRKYVDIKAEVASMLGGDFDNFMEKMANFVKDRKVKGQPVTVEVKTYEGSEFDLDSEFGDDALSDLINDWLEQYAKNGKMGKAIGDKSKYAYQNVHIEANSRAAKKLQRELIKYLKSLGVEAFAPNLRLGRIPVGLGPNANSK